MTSLRRRRTLVWVLRILVGGALVLALRGALAHHPPRLIARAGATTGCGGPDLAAGSVSYAMDSGGMTRSYLLHVPRAYSPTRPLPLVVNFHGFSMSGELEQRYSNMSALADRAGFVVVYPDGTPARGLLSLVLPERGWSDGHGNRFPGNDVRFADDLIDLLTRRLCIDSQRIFAVGLSNGGGMVDHLACLGDRRIAAIATVAGAFHTLPSGCHPARSLPVLAIQGTADPIVPYGGYAPDGIPATQAWAAAWARRDGCVMRPNMGRVAPDVVQVNYGGCRDGVRVVVDAVLKGGHTWPGARDKVLQLGRTAADFDATRAIWQFLQSSHGGISQSSTF